MEEAPRLVRELLLFSLLGFSPILLLVAVLGGLTTIIKLRGVNQARTAHRAGRLRSDSALRIARRTHRNKQSCLLFASADRPGFSKLGGAPELPLGVGWPEGASGQLRFLCQIDLADAREAGSPEWLPASGRLYAFHGEVNGSPNQVRIILASAEAELALASPRDPSAWLYAERLIGFAHRDSFPSLDWLDEDLSAVDSDELDDLVGLSDPNWDGPLHKLGGHPDELQEAQMAVDCELLRNEGRGVDTPRAVAQAVRRWRLLLQVDSDPALGISFGGGRLYVFVRPQDARRGNFQETVTLMQT